MAWSPILQCTDSMTMGVPAPEILTQQLSRRAVEIAQTIGPKRTGNALASIIAIGQPGIVAIEVPYRSAYLFDLEEGTTAHAMLDLSNRVIPIRNTDGTISFRKASANKIGQVPIITRLAKDGRIQSGGLQWYRQSTPAQSFLQKSVQQAIDEWQRTAKTKDIIDMLRQTKEKDAIDEILYGKA